MTDSSQTSYGAPNDPHVGVEVKFCSLNGYDAEAQQGRETPREELRGALLSEAAKSDPKQLVNFLPADIVEEMKKIGSGKSRKVVILHNLPFEPLPPQTEPFPTQKFLGRPKEEYEAMAAGMVRDRVAPMHRLMLGIGRMIGTPFMDAPIHVIRNYAGSATVIPDHAGELHNDYTGWTIAGCAVNTENAPTEFIDLHAAFHSLSERDRAFIKVRVPEQSIILTEEQALGGAPKPQPPKMLGMTLDEALKKPNTLMLDIYKGIQATNIPSVNKRLDAAVKKYTTEIIPQPGTILVYSSHIGLVHRGKNAEKVWHTMPRTLHYVSSAWPGKDEQATGYSL